MGEKNISVLGGTMQYNKLNKELQEKDQKTFDYFKINIWLEMLKDGMKPVNWSTSKIGTKVKFEYFQTEEDQTQGLNELKGFIHTYNLNYGTELKLTFS